MAGLLLTTEVVVGALLLLALFVVVSVITRRRLIARDSELTLCFLRLSPDSRWRTGLLRMGAAGLEWYPLFGFLPRKSHQWPRNGLDIGGVADVPNPLNPNLSRAVRISFRSTCSLEGVEEGDLVVPADAYTGLRAWLESAPPMHPEATS